MKKTKMLKKNYEFRKVFNKGKYYSGQYIEVFIVPNHKNINLLGLAISVKTGKAVKRNLIKRLIRENYKEMESKTVVGNSIIFLWKKKASIEDVSYYHIHMDMENIFEKAKILKEDS